MAVLLWITGDSAVGKDHFIRHRECADVSSLMQRIGLGMEFQRKELNRPAITTALNEGNNVIVKWQAIQRSWVPEFKDARPNVKHAVIHLLRPPEDGLRQYIQHRGLTTREHDYHCPRNNAWCHAYRGKVDLYAAVIIRNGEYLLTEFDPREIADPKLSHGRA